MIQVIFISNRTMPLIKKYFLDHNNGTLANWTAWYELNREHLLVVEEKDPKQPEFIEWVVLSRSDFESMYDLVTYEFGRENSPHYGFIECRKHGFNPITQCWSKLLTYPDYEINGQGFIRKIDDVESAAIMQFRGRQSVDTEGWYAKLSLNGGKKHNVWVDLITEPGYLGDKEYKA